ncbi:MAG: amino acid ABC transporter substrate-binding protein [Reyranella sp.]|nr:amino acid ABC transporter substrate-binding protein [Reyranella sp.]MDP3160293.1 amino acid ABC transporter substrate-binding protein [Reyranella sp.]
MHIINRGFGASVAWVMAALGAALFAMPASAESTLDAVKKRGQLICGVNGQAPGFSLFNAVKEWQGLDVDLCRAVAAAVLGDAKKVKYVPVTAQQRFQVLEAGEIDVLARNSTVTLQRDAGLKVTYAAINYFDGQAFVVPSKLNVKSLALLGGATICFTRGTTHEANMMNWFRVRKMTVMPLGFDTPDAMFDAFLASRCAAVTQDATALAAALVRRGKTEGYTMLNDIISKEPLGPYVRDNDSAWREVVRWTHYAMLEAEERDITRANVDQERRSADQEVRLFLGVVPGNGKALGLDEDWAYNIVKQVGNYSESYERNLGMGSSLKLGRRINALWNQGGQMYPPPLR